MKYLSQSDFETRGSQQIASIFKKLGYQTCCESLDVRDLEFSYLLEKTIYSAYLIAEEPICDLKIILFGIFSSEWNNRIDIIKRVLNSLKQRPSKFLLLFTCDYRKLIISNCTNSLNEDFELTTKIGIAEISIVNPGIAEINLLNKLALSNIDNSFFANLTNTLNDYYERYPIRNVSKKNSYTDESIRMYLQEIGRIRLLWAEEEITLARQIADLMYLESILETLTLKLERNPSDLEWAKQVWKVETTKQRLTTAKKKNIEIYLSNPANEINLEAEWSRQTHKNFAVFRRRLFLNRRAKDKMVQANLRLVVSIAKKYCGRGLDFLDLIQEGSFGLIRAAEKFDHEKGYKFSTYATWWVRQAITRAIADKSRTIRLPVHIYETISRIKKTTKLLSQEMHRKPTEKEIAEEMEMTIQKLRFIIQSAQLVTSLDIELSEAIPLGYSIPSNLPSPEDYATAKLLREDIELVLNTLRPREQDVLRLRYGLDDGREKTLEEIGQIFNVTRERIRQIESKALFKLRRSNSNSMLDEYIK